MMMRLDREFYRQDAVLLAKSLLGKIICVHQKGVIRRCRIIETEAYGGITDKAAHSYNNRKTARTEVMYRDGGYIYVYLIYGIYYLFNIVANIEGVPEAVLIRGAESLDNEKPRLDGPGKLTKSMGIDKNHNGLDLVKSRNIYLIDDGYICKEIISAKRINIDYAGEDKERLWRFFIKKTK